MTYVEWNDHIANYFFKPENAGKDVLFYLTRLDLVKYSRIKFTRASDEEIWSDYLSAIRFGGGNYNEFAIQYSPINRPLELYSEWDKRETPPFIGYLILFIIPLTETYDEHFNTTNYYGKINSFFRTHAILNGTTNETISTSNFQTISHLWNELEEWAIITKSCDLGIFELKKFGNPNWIHVGKPLSQCVLPPSSINKLPELFYQAGLIPDSFYSNAELRNILLRNGSRTLGLKASVVELIRSESNELGQSILEIVKREYNKWTGETHEEEEEDGAHQRSRRNYTVAPLFLQFKVNSNDGIITFSYRIYSSNDYPEDLRILEFENLYEINGWSKTLDLKFSEAFELEDDFNKWVARFPDRDVRLFINAGTFQLSTQYWIETESLSKTDQMFLLCKDSIKPSIIAWGDTFSSGNFHEEDLDGLPEHYSLFKILNPVASHSDIPLLTLFNDKKIELIGGLKLNFRTFHSDYLPEVEITNSDGNERIYLQYRNTEDKIFLERKKSNSNRWLLPLEILLNTDFDIKAEGENFSGNEIAYHIISSKDASVKVDGADLPKRDSFGKHVVSKPEQYCTGNNLINPMKASQRFICPWGNLFITLNEDSPTITTKTSFDNHGGNQLCDFLSLKKVLTTEEFYSAFEFFYSKDFSEKQKAGNFNLTRIKKIALNYYDYTGILDYDYEAKKIVLSPPQMVFIPSDKGRKVLLIGARDKSMTELIIDTAPRHNLQVEITRQFSSNENLLLPDAITIKAFGKRTEGYGERDLISFARAVNIKFTEAYFVQIALELFSAEITEYEKALLAFNETSQEDYGWARRVFNPDSLTYERSDSVTFDKSFALIEHKLNEYTYYNKLWENGKCYSVDKNWGKYLALKHFNRSVILADDEHKKVAIPLETPLPKLLAKSIMLLSGLAPYFLEISGRYYRVYENIPGVFTQNLFQKLGQKPINRELK